MVITSGDGGQILAEKARDVSKSKELPESSLRHRLSSKEVQRTIVKARDNPERENNETSKGARIG